MFCLTCLFCYVSENPKNCDCYFSGNPLDCDCYVSGNPLNCSYWYEYVSGNALSSDCYVSGNPLSCDCSLTYLHTWLLASSNSSSVALTTSLSEESVLSARCATPLSLANAPLAEVPAPLGKFQLI